MLRSLYSGISGLNAHQRMIDVTGNNIANVNTAGYKSSQIQFTDTLSQMMYAAGSPQGGQGGTNPAQVGLGVKVSAINTNFAQGSTQTTGRSGDMLIQGDGFFVTRSGNEMLYTRAGSFSVDANGTLVTSSGEPIQGWTGVNGVVNSAGQPGDIRMPVGASIPPARTSQMGLKGNLSSDVPPPPAVDDVVTIPVRVYDNSGATSTATVEFRRDTTAVPASTDWTVTLTKADGTVVGAPVTLDMASGRPGAGTMPPMDAEGNIVFDLGGPDEYKVNVSDMTMYSGQSDARVFSTDGQTAGTLTSTGFTVSNTGEIVGVFSNGLKQVLGQVAVATFTNPNGLEKVGNSQFRSTVNSGYAQVGEAGSGGMGQLVGGALEMSNVDLAQEFTNLVVAQRGFQANSRIITTSDELLQELVSMKR
ncbi:flagellar hook protein FlgE [Actinoplanes campanulatus]|uniref:Flagellar hook protein FlgE n=1 Tax=Actinoplanes campanulatus TaxID=113559 RepID=A0A7W5FG08_9ACTN|nr:flagellar hook protein FlgE [Actinoplanes campanulatus]MBB3097046.1 flagellar hook protein FlgE [Actinoplanes campanulatus]GGN15279.1 flagellar hook protein FlgE [Actinoplanes campanulatus]GID37773.1 flagellar hook protein FlgE [Actinoplanes campanulatus]